MFSTGKTNIAHNSMSTNKRYIGTFTAHNDGRDMPAQILIMSTEGDSTSVVVEELKLAADPVLLTWDSAELYDCTQGCQMEVSLIAEHDGQYREIYEHDGKVYATLVLDGKEWWSGVYARETWSEPFSINKNYIVKLTFSDFNYLSRVPFDSSVFDNRANLPLRDLLLYGCRLFNPSLTASRLLSSIPLGAGTVEISLVTAGNVADTNMLDCVLNVLFLDGRTWKEVLDLVFGSICCRLKQYNGNIVAHILMGVNVAGVVTARKSLNAAAMDAELRSAGRYHRIALDYDNERGSLLGVEDFSGYSPEDIILESTSPGIPAIGPAYEIGKTGAYGAFDAMDYENYDYKDAAELSTALIMQSPMMTEQQIQSRGLSVYGNDKSYSSIDKDSDICHPSLEVSVNNTWGGVSGSDLYVSFEVWYQYDVNRTRLDLEGSAKFRQIKFYIAYTYDDGTRRMVTKTVEYTPEAAATDEEKETNDIFFNKRGNTTSSEDFATVEVTIPAPQGMSNHIARIELIPFVEWRDNAPSPQWVAIAGLVFRNFKVELKSRDVSNLEVMTNSRNRNISFGDGNELSLSYEVSAPADSSAAAKGVISGGASLNDVGDEYLDRIVDMLRYNYGDMATRQRWIVSGSYRYDHVASPLILFSTESVPLSTLSNVDGFCVRSELWHIRSGICSLELEEYISCSVTHVSRSATSSPSSLNFNGKGGTKVLKIYSNTNWVAISRDGVLSLAGKSGSGCGKLEVTAPARPSGSVTPVRYIDVYSKNDPREAILSIEVIQ